MNKDAVSITAMWSSDGDTVVAALLALNNAHEVELSRLDRPGLRRLIDRAFVATPHISSLLWDGRVWRRAAGPADLANSSVEGEWGARSGWVGGAACTVHQIVVRTHALRARTRPLASYRRPPDNSVEFLGD